MLSLIYMQFFLSTKQLRLFALFLLLVGIIGCSPSTPQSSPTPTTISPSAMISSAPSTALLSLQRPARVVLVLGSGGTRGLANIGVLKILQQQHIPIDLIVATDSGALVGALYAQSNNLHQTQQILFDPQFVNLMNTSALQAIYGNSNGLYLQQFVTQHLQLHNFKQLRTPLVITTTNFRNGNTIVLTNGLLAPAITAALATPPYYAPVKLYGYTLINGSTTDPIPVDIAQLYQPKTIIAINLSAPWPHTVPTNAIDVFTRCSAISEAQFNQACAATANVVIHPKVSSLLPTTLAQKFALVRAGEQATRQALPQICSRLQQNHIASDCSNAKIIKPVAPQSPIKPESKAKQLLKKTAQEIKSLPKRVSHLP